MSWHLLLDVRRGGPVPLVEQITDQLRREIARGRLLPRTRLPSSRSLAADLHVSRSVVVEAYEKLTGEGLLEAVRGSGTRVANHVGADMSKPVVLAEPTIPKVRFNLLPGIPNPATFPHREWITSYRRAMETTGALGLGYPPLFGVEELRTELVRYLGRVRGVLGTPENTCVTGGFTHGLSLLCSGLRELGIDSMAIEDPSHDGQRQFIEQNNIRTVPVPVGPDGLEVQRLYESKVGAVLVTPSHQFPLGVPMTTGRRRELARWAQDTNGWIIEDDYDGGLWLRQRSRTLALQPVAPERVIYAGTASKMMAPGLRLGWMVLPPPLVPVVERVRARRDLGCDGPMQLAFAGFLRDGLLDRHLRQMRRRYRDQHMVFRQALEKHLPMSALLGAVSGLHAYVRLPPDTDEERLVEGALCRSVLVKGGRAFHATPTAAWPALVIGYTALDKSMIPEAVHRIGEVLEELAIR